MRAGVFFLLIGSLVLSAFSAPLHSTTFDEHVGRGLTPRSPLSKGAAVGIGLGAAGAVGAGAAAAAVLSSQKNKPAAPPSPPPVPTGVPFDKYGGATHGPGGATFDFSEGILRVRPFKAGDRPRDVGKIMDALAMGPEWTAEQTAARQHVLSNPSLVYRIAGGDAALKADAAAALNKAFRLSEHLG